MKDLYWELFEAEYTHYLDGIRSTRGRKWQLGLNIVVTLPPKPPRLDRYRFYVMQIVKSILYGFIMIVVWVWVEHSPYHKKHADKLNHWNNDIMNVMIENALLI